MKKTQWLSALILTLALLLLAGCAAPQGQAQYIGADKAKELALKAAGVSEAGAEITSMDMGDGEHYEIAFNANGEAYLFNVNAVSGEVAKVTAAPASVPANSGSVATDPGQAVQAPAESVAAATAAPAGRIAEAEAKAIALEHAGVSEADATFIRCHLDYDDGRQEYEVEFWSGNMEYDYEVDAFTGDIRNFDQDAEYYAPSGNSGSNSGGSGSNSDERIGSGRAKAIALNHAGVSESEARGMQCELDRDDGRTVYEIEFYADRMEYDYEVDAFTGEVLKSQKEWDD